MIGEFGKYEDSSFTLYQGVMLAFPTPNTSERNLTAMGLTTQRSCGEEASKGGRACPAHTLQSQMWPVEAPSVQRKEANEAKIALEDIGHFSNTGSTPAKDTGKTGVQLTPPSPRL